MSLQGMAQDDMYFISSKKSKATAETEQATEDAASQQTVRASTRRYSQETDVIGCDRDVDEYNRRGSRDAAVDDGEVIITDTLGMQWVLQRDANGESVWVPLEDAQEDRQYAEAEEDDSSYDYDDDYYYTRRLARFCGYYSPWLAWYDPWYDYWYDPWYGWYGYYPWYGYGWGYYPWHGWYGYGGWYGFHGGHYRGGRYGGTFGHQGGGALASGSRQSGNRHGTYNSAGRSSSRYVLPNGVSSRSRSLASSNGTSRSAGSVSRSSSNKNYSTSGTSTSRSSRSSSTSSTSRSSRCSSSSLSSCCMSWGSWRCSGFSSGFSGGSRGGFGGGGGFSGGGGRGGGGGRR